METARINEVLAQQIAVVRGQADRLDNRDVPRLRIEVAEMEKSVGRLKELVDALP
ncbi:hypothetical protein Geob_1350 [Geotalea daltonii FRC-32]|uniref:Uncharacterized protein n=1 Tax=Geotalea daltonii (strain DSM 22248 / JCM 15807 / FRC-32) TaxID=316067 RepID=B9M4I4_GEODF|nr:hypothetical protein [Geotalea daltonii]ACM19710.1 hypothetical protein Geob_1350 [Geotalea daltonii FRC-32]